MIHRVRAVLPLRVDRQPQLSAVHVILPMHCALSHTPRIVRLYLDNVLFGIPTLYDVPTGDDVQKEVVLLTPMVMILPRF